MSNYRRPWWLVVNKPTGLITTVHEEPAGPGEQVYIIKGEPVVQGLAWLTWGPVGALAVILLLTGLAISFKISEGSGATKFLFVAAFLALPALAWGVATIIASRASARHLAAERQAEAQEAYICLNQARGELIYQPPGATRRQALPFEAIRRVKVAPPIGARNVKQLRLALETDNGPVVLLPESLGTQNQKIDLSQQIQEALKNYAQNKKSP